MIDAIVMDSDTGSLIAIEMETSNSKNKSNSDLRLKILSKYLQELENTHGLYEFVYMYSHRQRFLTQIEKAHSRIFATGKHKFTRSQQDLLTSRIKFKATECNTIYELMFNTNRPLGDDKLALIRKYKYFDKLTELEMLAKDTDDRVLQIKIEAFKEAGIVIGLID